MSELDLTELFRPKSEDSGGDVDLDPELLALLRGWEALHELRKEAGALVAKSAGIYAASRLLRQSDIRVSADYYADKKQHISTGLGALLTAENVIAFKPETASKNPKAERKHA